MEGAFSKNIKNKKEEKNQVWCVRKVRGSVGRWIKIT